MSENLAERLHSAFLETFPEGIQNIHVSVSRTGRNNPEKVVAGIIEALRQYREGLTVPYSDAEGFQ